MIKKPFSSCKGTAQIGTNLDVMSADRLTEEHRIERHDFADSNRLHIQEPGDTLFILPGNETALALNQVQNGKKSGLFGRIANQDIADSLFQRRR
jgi:hypothetical protein